MNVLGFKKIDKNCVQNILTRVTWDAEIYFNSQDTINHSKQCNTKKIKMLFKINLYLYYIYIFTIACRKSRNTSMKLYKRKGIMCDVKRRAMCHRVFYAVITKLKLYMCLKTSHSCI